MTGTELERAVIEKHSIPWFDHNLERDTILLRSDGKTKGLKETFTIIKLFYNKDTEMLKAIMKVFKQGEKDEKTTLLIPHSQIKSMEANDPRTKLRQ